MATSADFKPKRPTISKEETVRIVESRKEKMGYLQEWPRQKLRISDLYPDEQFIKENSEHEYRYFILLVFPVVVTAALVIINRNGLYDELVFFLENLLAGF